MLLKLKNLPLLESHRGLTTLPSGKLLINTINERVPFLFLALIAWSLPEIGTTAGLIMTFLALVWQGMGSGLAANAWQNMIGKVIPPDFLATRHAAWTI